MEVLKPPEEDEDWFKRAGDLATNRYEDMFDEKFGGDGENNFGRTTQETEEGV